MKFSIRALNFVSYSNFTANIAIEYQTGNFSVRYFINYDNLKFCDPNVKFILIITIQDAMLVAF